MDEIERRLTATELAVTEVFAWRNSDDLDDARRSIRDGLATCGAEERSVRLGAIALIADARDRFRFGVGGPAT